MCSVVANSLNFVEGAQIHHPLGRCCAFSEGSCRGQSAVEQSAYISRTSLYSDYYGMTYNRTAKEDLVGAGVLLPEHAPPEFADRAVLWNSVEKYEKAKNAQLARSLKYSLPNEWDEATARQVMERFIKNTSLMFFYEKLSAHKVHEPIWHYYSIITQEKATSHR